MTDNTAIGFHSPAGIAGSEYYLEYLENLPELVTKTQNFNIVRDATGDSASGLWEPEVKSLVDSATLKSMFFTEEWVFILVDLVAGKLGNQRLKVMGKSIVDGEEVFKPNMGHPLQALINNPNKFQDYYAWMYSLIVDLVLLGNSIQWNSGGADMILGLPAESVVMKFGTDGAVSSYVVYDYMDGFNAKTMAFPANEIAHIRRPNPNSLLWGMSPFIPAQGSILFDRYSSEYLNSFYIKGAAPGLALEMDKDANEKNALRLLRSFEAAYTGRRNQRRTLVFPKGVSVREVGQKIADQNLPELVRMNREELMAIIKAPKHELGLQESGSLGSEEHKTALRNFWESFLMPTASMVDGALTAFFKPTLGPNNILKFDLSNVPALKEDELAKATLAEKMLVSQTLNEVRKTVWKLGPLPGGDATPQPKQTAAPGGFPALPAPAAHPQPTTTQAPPQLPAAPDTNLSAESTGTKDVSISSAKVNMSSFRKAHGDWFSQREAKISTVAKKSSDELGALALRMFSEMSTTISTTARKFLKEKGYDAPALKVTEAGNSVKPKTKLVGAAELRRRLRSSLSKFEERWIADTQKALVASVDVGYDAMIEVPFNLPSASEMPALKARGAQARMDALEERGGRAFEYMNETTINKVFSVIEDGIASNKTIAEIAVDLREKFANIDEIQSRANTIARTEVLTAVSLGQAAAMQDAATVVPDLQKMWVTADDDRVRDAHAAVDGEVKAWDDPFDNGLYFPRDPSGPAELVINCRCSLVMLPKDQMSEVSGDNLVANEAAE